MAKALDNGKAVDIDLRYAKDLVCEKCGGGDFYSAMKIKLLPRLAYGLQKDELVLVDSMICAHCNNSIAGVANLVEAKPKIIIDGAT